VLTHLLFPKYFFQHFCLASSKYDFITSVLRGNAKFQGPPKPKPAKCPLSAVRQSLQALQKIKITWNEPPARQINAALKPILTKTSKMSTLLSHKLIWTKILTLLETNLKNKFKPTLKLLRRNIFFYQLAVMWLYITYFYAAPFVLNRLVSYNGFDACWICKRLHSPFDCSKINIQITWTAIQAGIPLFSD